VREMFFRTNGVWEGAIIEELTIARGENFVLDGRIGSAEGVAKAACGLVDLVVV
jgi:hypothetical protein